MTLLLVAVKGAELVGWQMNGWLNRMIHISNCVVMRALSSERLCNPWNSCQLLLLLLIIVLDERNYQNSFKIKNTSYLSNQSLNKESYLNYLNMIKRSSGGVCWSVSNNYYYHNTNETNTNKYLSTNTTKCTINSLYLSIFLTSYIIKKFIFWLSLIIINSTYN